MKGKLKRFFPRGTVRIVRGVLFFKHASAQLRKFVWRIRLTPTTAVLSLHSPHRSHPFQHNSLRPLICRVSSSLSKDLRGSDRGSDVHKAHETAGKTLHTIHTTSLRTAHFAEFRQPLQRSSRIMSFFSTGFSSMLNERHLKKAAKKKGMGRCAATCEKSYVALSLVHRLR